jgi:hypothetical protein
MAWISLMGDAGVWWNEVKSKEIHALSDKEYEKKFLNKWSRSKSKDNECTKSLFACGKSILQVPGCIHKEKIIVSINPSCRHNFINVSWLIDCKLLQRIFKAHRLKVKIFKFLKI